VGDTGLVMQRAVEFITGAKDINSDANWNAYKDEIKRAGRDRYVEIWNEALSKAAL
jgi:putative aldouronate transport system substrate-binding protein